VLLDVEIVSQQPLASGDGALLNPNKEITLRAVLTNHGSRVSIGTNATIYIPKVALTAEHNARGGTETIEGSEYKIWPLGVTPGVRLYLKRPIDTRRHFIFAPEHEEVELLWRADDDEFTYPNQGYGRIRLNLNEQKRDI